MKNIPFEHIDKVDELQSLCRKYTKLTGSTATFHQEFWYRMRKTELEECEEWAVMVFDSEKVFNSIRETTLDGAIEFMLGVLHGITTD